MKKVVILFLFAFLISLSLIGCDSLGAKEAPASDFEYELSSNGENIVITKYIGSQDNVVIPKEIDGLPVKSLKNAYPDGVAVGVFEGSNIKSVTIPDTVTLIGSSAFNGCKELTEVKLPKNLKHISVGAFSDCTSLKSIDLSKTQLIRIEWFAFKGCTSLTDIKFSSTLTDIWDGAFYGCSAFTDLKLPESLKTIGKSAFSECTSLKTVTIPKNVSLSPSLPAFSELPSLEKMIFEEGRAEINGYAFFANTSNVDIIIPKSVEKFSCNTFIVNDSARFIFHGNCPELIESATFGNSKPTILYDKSASGWDDCEWNGKYTLEPIK